MVMMVVIVAIIMMMVIMIVIMMVVVVVVIMVVIVVMQRTAHRTVSNSHSLIGCAMSASPVTLQPSSFLFRNIIVAESQLFVSQGRKFDVYAVDHRETG